MVIYWTYLHLILIIPLVFLLFILSKNLKSNSRKFYFISISSFVFWMLFNFLYVNSFSRSIATIFYSLMLISISIASGALFLTAVNFHKKACCWYYLISLIPLITLIFIVPLKPVLTNFGWQVVYTPQFFLWELFIFLIVLIGVYLLILLRKEVRSKVLKKKLFYLILSSFLSVFSGVIDTFFTFSYNLPSVSGILASLFVMITYFAFKK